MLYKICIKLNYTVSKMLMIDKKKFNLRTWKKLIFIRRNSRTKITLRRLHVSYTLVY